MYHVMPFVVFLSLKCPGRCPEDVIGAWFLFHQTRTCLSNDFPAPSNLYGLDMRSIPIFNPSPPRVSLSQQLVFLLLKLSQLLLELSQLSGKLPPK